MKEKQTKRICNTFDTFLNSLTKTIATTTITIQKRKEKHMLFNIHFIMELKSKAFMVRKPQQSYNNNNRKKHFKTGSLVVRDYWEAFTFVYNNKHNLDFDSLSVFTLRFKVVAIVVYSVSVVIVIVVVFVFF